MPSLELDLVTAPDDASLELSLNKPFFETTTDASGHFVFQSVTPGRYLLGSNIIGLNSSSVPATFYPGRRSRSGAIPVEVELGETVEDLLLTLPDFGKPREIELCVVGEDGKLVAGAHVGSDAELVDHPDDSASLGENLVTDKTGCVKVSGYSTVAYSVSASFRLTGGDIRQSQFSNSILIEPGALICHLALPSFWSLDFTTQS